MRRLALAFLLLMPLPVRAVNLELDKLVHFGVGYIAADALDDLGRARGGARWSRVVMSLGTGIVLASLKEGYDSLQPKNKWDWSDWGHTVAGAGVAVTFNFTF